MVGELNVVDVPVLESDIDDGMLHPELSVEVEHEKWCVGSLDTGVI